MTKLTLQYSGSKDGLFNKWCRIKWTFLEIKWSQSLSHTNSRWIEDLKVKTKIMEILDYNMIEYHHHFGVGKDLLKWHMKHSRQGNIETTDNNKQWNKKKGKSQAKPQINGKNKIKQTDRNKETHTHTKETKTDPNKSKSQRTTWQTSNSEHVEQLEISCISDRKMDVPKAPSFWRAVCSFLIQLNL